MKAAELRERSTTELEQELTDLLREQFNLRMQKLSSGQGMDVSKFSKTRKAIARVKTILNEQRMKQHTKERSS
jgi:large subunit ribosomal protein L29